MTRLNHISREMRVYYLNRELERVNDAIAHHELRAAIPPASCTEVDLFASSELAFAQCYRLRASHIRDELVRLQGQLEFSLVG
jgi:hypothetical protein